MQSLVREAVNDKFTKLKTSGIILTMTDTF